METSRDRPLSLSRLIERLDVPDCGCPLVEISCGCPGPCQCPVLYGPPCEHIRAAGHETSLRNWAALQALALPGEYVPPPPPARPSTALTRAARIAVMEQRESAGRNLYHPGDLWRPENARTLEAICSHLAKQSTRLRNGRDPEEEDLVLNGVTEDEEAELEDLEMESAYRAWHGQHRRIA